MALFWLCNPYSSYTVVVDVDQVCMFYIMMSLSGLRATANDVVSLGTSDTTSHSLCANQQSARRKVTCVELR